MVCLVKGDRLQGFPICQQFDRNAIRPNDWKYTWNGLPVNRNGEAISYTVEEINVPAGYSAPFQTGFPMCMTSGFLDLALPPHQKLSGFRLLPHTTGRLWILGAHDPGFWQMETRQT